MAKTKFQQQMKKARKGGLTPLDMLRLRTIAQKEAEKAETVATEKAFLYMLAIPLNVLVNDYWSKTAKRKAPKFIEEVLKLYDVVECNIVSDEELAELLNDMAGVTISADWIEKRDVNPIAIVDAIIRNKRIKKDAMRTIALHLLEHVDCGDEGEVDKDE